MMQDIFQPKTWAVVRAHRDQPWSTINGWLILLKEIYRSRMKGEEQRLDSLWFVLCTLSILSWTFVISGLSMEAYDAQKAGTTPGAEVVGVNQLTMNNRPTGPFLDAVFRAWSTNLDPEIPLHSANLRPAREPAHREHVDTQCAAD